jgi:hypothetical protein
MQFDRTGQESILQTVQKWEKPCNTGSLLKDCKRSGEWTNSVQVNPILFHSIVQPDKFVKICSARQICQNLFSPTNLSKSVQPDKFVKICSTRLICQNLFSPTNSSKSVQPDKFVKICSARQIRQNLFSPTNSSKSVQPD